MLNDNTTYKTALISEFSNLLTRCKDAERGFIKAAEEVENSFLKSMLEKDAARRRSFAKEIAREIRLMGGNADMETSIVADLHRNWMGLRSTLASDRAANDKLILEECLRGEEEFERAYREVLNADHPLTLRHKEMIDAHMSVFKDTRKRIKSLKETTFA